ncbi:MAG TPA: hypothetical protein VK620_36585 [Bradyrhizobium sp.]|jgi:hypothetical protein|nr:hypothetical protein [Bradyrhizobium sp.]
MIANIRRLPEALKMSAIAIEDLYKELNRTPPQEATDLIKELHELARDILTSQDFLNSKIKL